METEETRKPTYDELLVEVARIPGLEAQIVELKAQVDTLTQMLFGKKSEKSKKDKEQPQATPETGSQVSSESAADEPPVEEPKRQRQKNGGGGRNSLPPNIPRRDIHVSLSPEECCCANCGKDFVPMGIEITEVLHYIPMFLEVLRFIRQRMKAACTCFGTKIVIAEPPIRTIDKGLVTTEFIAAMLMNKYCDHLPMHRQVGRLLKSAKVKIAESSINLSERSVADAV